MFSLMLEMIVLHSMFQLTMIIKIILEGNEMFNLTVDASSLPSSVTVGDHGHATVIIVDNDGKCEAINALIQNCCHAIFKPKAL